MKTIALPNLVNPISFGIKADIMWWATNEAKQDYFITQGELQEIGINNETIFIHQDLILSLLSANNELRKHL
jgi:hypothetical protein